MPFYPYANQTAVKSGDAPMLQLSVHSNSDAPAVSIDLPAFDLSSSSASTTAGHWGGYGATYYPSYWYVFGPFPITPAVKDGTYPIAITATNDEGTAVGTTTIIVDNVPPTISLSGITFASSTLQQFGTVYLSGTADGTGSAIKAANVAEELVDANGKVISSGYASNLSDANTSALNAAFASSTDGTFANVPTTFYRVTSDQDLPSDAVALKVSLTAYDGAGYATTTSLTVPLPLDPCATPGACASNVLFLPGIEGSRLYEGTGCGKGSEERLWEPVEDGTFGLIAGILRGAGNAKLGELGLDASGESTCADIYAKTGGIIDAVNGDPLYQGLISELDGLKTEGTINDWEPAAYDWRLSLDDLLSKGTERSGTIHYEDATSTPYIEQTLRRLAASSKTGKVTIIAHSNGGLVAKALLKKLGSEAPGLVDRLVLVASPQNGAPTGLAALLLGYDAGIYYKNFIPIVSDAAAQAFSQNSPMAYHLLPSEDYLESTAGDAAHPVVRLSGNAFSDEEAKYGTTIGNRAALDGFIKAYDSSAQPGLIDYANRTHDSLDGWSPPASIVVDEIAGWGVDTVAGIDFYTLPPLSSALAIAAPRAYRPIFTEDGDGTVAVPSALEMASSTQVKRYWLDLSTYYKDTRTKHTHADIFEVPSLQTFIKNLIENSTSTLPAYITTTAPPPNAADKKLLFFLRASSTPEAANSSPTLRVADTSGKVTGLAPDGSMTEDIPGSTYGEFGGVRYVTVPEGDPYELTIDGQGDSTFSLDLQESSGGTITATSSVAGIPTTAQTVATFSVSSVGSPTPIRVDENGDGTDVLTVTPQAGETVVYDPSLDESVPDSSSATSTDETSGSDTASSTEETPAPEPEPQPAPAGSTDQESSPPAVATSPAPNGSISIPVLASVPAAAPSDTPFAVPDSAGIPSVPDTSGSLTSNPDSGSQTSPAFEGQDVPAAAASSGPVALAVPAEPAPVPPAQPVASSSAAPDTGGSQAPSPSAAPAPQTASVYDASQQIPASWFSRLMSAVYNALHALWLAISSFF